MALHRPSVGYNRSAFMGGQHIPLLKGFFRQHVGGAMIVVFAAALCLCPPAASAQTVRKPAAPAQAKHRAQPEADELTPTPEDIEERKRQEALAARVDELRAKARGEVKAAAHSVHSAELGVLAKALGADVKSQPGDDPEESGSALQEIGDLDGDGVSEVVFRWSVRERFKSKQSEGALPLPAWDLFVLSWDGLAWRDSELTVGYEIYDLQVLKRLGSAPAVAVIERQGLIPYPVVFRYRDHGASLLWDSQDDRSLYQGYAQGEIEFHEPTANTPPAMVVAGKADPGVLHFPPTSRRGFNVATLYVWEGNAYVPRKTEFAENQDYTLYRFISALHMHDFAAAYALINPVQFLPSKEKTADAFRKFIEAAWPEFLGNNIFEALDPPDGSTNPSVFALDRENIHYRYAPTFSDDGKFLLISLERQEIK